jgi:hypothetical protein
MAFTGAGGSAAASAGASQVLGSDETERIRVLGLSPRQSALDKRWAYYRCDQYSPRKVAWDGSRVVGQVEHDSIALAGYVPPGFYLANNDTLPIAFRKPSSPYHLCKVVVDRFTGLLFGQKRHPKVSIAGDQASEDFVNAVIEEGRMWSAMMQARTFGGATGSAVVGFKLLNGKPQFEVFDPRWCTPKFIDRHNYILGELEYRYTFKHEIMDPVSGGWVEAEFWFRRVINTKSDIIYEPVLVDKNNMRPDWVPANEVTHGLGFCPVVWIQNEAQATEIDGDPDCLGIYDLCEAMDKLNSQAERGILANCDPTTVITTDAQMGEVSKGSNNAIKLPNGGSAQYMEMTGTGVNQAREQVLLYKDMALEVTQCVLEQPDGQKTATEVDRNYAAMLARADKFREQYGEMGVKRLINMVLVASQSLTKPRVEGAQIVRYQIRLNKRPDGTEQRLGKGPYVASLTWPPYFEPSIMDANTAVQAALGAKSGGLVDQKTATKFIAPFFQIEDVDDVANAAAAASGANQADLERMAVGGPSVDVNTEAPEKEADAALNGAQVTALADLIKSVALGELPASSALEIIVVGFPVDRATAERMLKDTGKVTAPTTDAAGAPAPAPEAGAAATDGPEVEIDTEAPSESVEPDPSLEE